MASLRPVDHHTRQQLNEHLVKIEEAFNADVITIISPVVHGLDQTVKQGLELFEHRKNRLVVVLDTLGGVVEVVERMVISIRHHYEEVYFVIPDRAMSAGTVFAMAGDKIFMNYFSCLGPIDPQIENEGKLVPALAYLVQYRRLCDKADSGELNTAEFTLLNKLDLGELHQFEQAQELSHDLLIDWLSGYKFKDWNVHSSTGNEVTAEEKRDRAKEVAASLSDNERWHSHGRSIFRDTLQNEIRLKIDNLEDVDDLEPALDEYFGLLKDYMTREQLRSFVHTREFF